MQRLLSDIDNYVDYLMENFQYIDMYKEHELTTIRKQLETMTDQRADDKEAVLDRKATEEEIRRMLDADAMRAIRSVQRY